MLPEFTNESDPLDQLRPIILPEHDISWWPLAPGWWILMALFFIVILLLWWLRPTLVKRQIKKQHWQSAHNLLEALYIQCNTQTNSTIALQYYLQNSNAIFKRTIHHLYEDRKLASLIGDDWIDFLNKVYPTKTGRYTHLYGEQLYAKHCTENIKLKELHAWACLWIKALQKHAKNTSRIKKDV